IADVLDRPERARLHDPPPRAAGTGAGRAAPNRARAPCGDLRSPHLALQLTPRMDTPGSRPGHIRADRILEDPEPGAPSTRSGSSTAPSTCSPPHPPGRGGSP